MKIGVLSDTHNHTGNLKRALAIFRQEGVDTLIHCGDMSSPETAVHITGFTVIYVYGNMDANCNGIGRALSKHNPGSTAANTFTGELIPGVRVAATHGHTPGQVDSFIRNDYDYVFHGHTHRRRDEIIGKTRIINPGALGGSQHEPRSICLLNLKTGQARFIEIAQ